MNDPFCSLMSSGKKIALVSEMLSVIDENAKVQVAGQGKTPASVLIGD